MSKLLDMVNDDAQDFTVVITDTDGVTATYELLDIVCYRNTEYAVLLPEDEDEVVDIFQILPDGEKETYVRVTDDGTLEEVFDLFRIKNEDEFDFA